MPIWVAALFALGVFLIGGWGRATVKPWEKALGELRLPVPGRAEGA